MLKSQRDLLLDELRFDAYDTWAQQVADPYVRDLKAGAFTALKLRPFLMLHP